MQFIRFNQCQAAKRIANIRVDMSRTKGSGTQVFLPACRFLLGFGLFGLFGFWFFGWFVYYQYLLALHGVR